MRIPAIMITGSMWLVLQAPPAQGEVDATKVLAGADVSALVQVLTANADITGDIILGLAARDRLADLGRRDPAAVVPALVAALNDGPAANQADQQRRIALISVLSDIGPGAEGAVPILRAIATDEDEPNDYVRQQASLALANIGTVDADAARDAADAQRIAQWSANADDNTARQAAEEHAFLIRQELRSTEPAEAMIEASLDLLQAGGAAAVIAVPTLLRAWSDPRLSGILHERIESVLVDLGIEAPAQAASGLAPVENIDGIIADTQSRYDLINSLAMMELGRLGPSPRVIAIFIEALREGRNPAAAALELGQFGEASRLALPELIPYLANDDVGPNAILAVSRIGDPSRTAATELRRIVARADSRHRGLAASALGKLKVAEAVPDLAKALKDERTQTRLLAARALGDIGPEAGGAVPHLAALLADPDNQVRVAAATALGRIGASAELAVPSLAALLGADDGRVRRAATAALQDIDLPTARLALSIDAARYADGDAAQFRSIRQSAPQRVDDLLRSLPEARRRQLAATIAQDGDFKVALTGAWTLVETGGDASAPFANLIAHHDEGRVLLTTLVRADLIALASAVIQHLRTSADTMSFAERERVNQALATIGEAAL